MDANADGYVTKEEFIDYLRSRPQLQNVMYSGLKPEESRPGEQNASASARPSPQTARAMGIKRIITVYKDIDKSKNGVATWEEFIDFFRRTDLLLMYSTPHNPRDRMAAVLANEYQQRQVVATEVEQGHSKTATKEGLSSNFLIAQKQQQLNTQWATEKFAQLQDQSSHGRDALSIAQDSVDALKKSARQVVGRPARKHTIIAQSNSTPEAPAVPAMQLDITDDESKPLPTMSLEVQPSHVTLKLPSLLQPLDTRCKLPFTRKGRSHSTVCDPSKVEKMIRQMTPRKTSSRCHSMKSGGSASPCKRLRGRTPRRALTTSLACQ